MLDNPKRKPDCPCTEECTRHGLCKECRAYHNDAGDLPYCKRPGLPAGDSASHEPHHKHGPGHHHHHQV